MRIPAPSWLRAYCAGALPGRTCCSQDGAMPNRSRQRRGTGRRSGEDRLPGHRTRTPSSDCSSTSACCARRRGETPNVRSGAAMRHLDGKWSPIRRAEREVRAAGSRSRRPKQHPSPRRSTRWLRNGPTPSAPGTDRSPRRGPHSHLPRCSRSYEVETTVSRGHDTAACSAHRLPNRGGSSVGQSSGLIIRRSQVQVLPAPRSFVWFRLMRDISAPAER